MIYENGTMDVRVDGKIERRRYSINVGIEPSNRYMQRVQRYEPELKPGEQCLYSITDDIPTIVTVSCPDGDPLQYSQDEERYVRFALERF